MKIAFCLEYPIGQAGGVSVLVLTLMRELAAECELTLVSPDAAEDLTPGKLGLKLHRHVPWSPADPTPQSAAALAKALAAVGVELAHFHFGGNFAWSNRFPSRCPIPRLARLGVPVVTTIHMAVGLLNGYCGPQKPLWFKLGYLPFAWLAKLSVLRHVLREIAVSRQDYDRLRCWYWPVRGKFVQIYHSRLRPADAPPSHAQREKIILAVGHIAQRKGQPVLAEAFARLADRHPDWKLLLVGHAGEGDTFQQLERVAARGPQPGQMALLGQRDDADQLMRRAAIYVQPSFHEGLPLSLQEALHNGCACIATRIPGNVELVEHERNGLLVPPGDVAALADALERLMNDVALREQFAARGRETISALGMTTAQMTQKHRELYAAVLTHA